MSWKIEVLAYGETKWAGNGLRFAAEQEAKDYGLDLFTRWTGCKEYRAVEADEPANYAWIGGDARRIEDFA